MPNDVEVFYLRRCGNNSFRQAEPKGEIGKIGGRRHHNGKRRSVVRQGYGRFFSKLASNKLTVLVMTIDADDCMRQVRLAPELRAVHCVLTQ